MISSPSSFRVLVFDERTEVQSLLPRRHDSGEKVSLSMLWGTWCKSKQTRLNSIEPFLTRWCFRCCHIVILQMDLIQIHIESERYNQPVKDGQNFSEANQRNRWRLAWNKTLETLVRAFGMSRPLLGFAVVIVFSFWRGIGIMSSI